MKSHPLLALAMFAALAPIGPAICAPTANAADRPVPLERHTAWHPNTDLSALMLSAARRYWAKIPPCGIPHVKVANPDPVIFDGADRRVAVGWVYNVGDPTADCTIYVSRDYWPRNTRTVIDFYPQICRVVTHEYGHLLGHGHIETPGRMMSPMLDDRVRDDACDSANIWYRNRLIKWRSGQILDAKGHVAIGTG